MTSLFIAIAAVVICGVLGTFVLWRGGKKESIGQIATARRDDGNTAQRVEAAQGGEVVVEGQGTLDMVRALAPVEDEGEGDVELVADVRVCDANSDVADGGFLVDLGDGTFVTLWLHHDGSTQRVAYLKGAEHSGRYSDFGFVKEAGVWVAAEFSEVVALVKGVSLLLGGGHVEAHERYLGDCAHYAGVTGCCGRCGHPLSSATSVWRGLGADCAVKAGTWRLC